MKRLFLIILILSLFLQSFAFADIYDQPILFRGLPWGCSYTDSLSALPEGVEMYAPSPTSSFTYINDVMLGRNSQYTKAKIGFLVKAKSWTLNGIKVAGYPLSDIFLLYTYPVGNDGLLIRDTDHGQLIYAYYTLEPTDIDTAYDDLTTKLTDLYGDVDNTTKIKSISINYLYKTWFGSDGTIVTLEKEVFSSGSHYIYIKYSYQDAETLQQKAVDAITLEEQQNAVSDHSGL